MEALCCFRCKKDSDIENFLKTKAIDYMNRKWCAIYLLLDEDCLDKNEFFILAYFTLSHKFLIPHEVSKNQIKKITGGVISEILHFVLIGQLGKFIDEAECSYISGKEVLDYAFEIIEDANELIPCRCVLVEC